MRVTPPPTLEEARALITRFVAYYNEKRLHSAIDYVTPADRLAGRHTEIKAARIARLEAARELRAAARNASPPPTRPSRASSPDPVAAPP